MSNNLFEDFDKIKEQVQEEHDDRVLKWSKKAQEKMEEEISSYDNSNTSLGIAGISGILHTSGWFSDNENMEIVSNMVDILNARGIASDIVTSAISAYASKGDNNFSDTFLQTLLTNEQITEKLDLTTLSLLLGEASKLDIDNKTIKQSIDFIKENKNALKMIYTFLDENGLSSTELASLANTFINTEGNNTTKFTAALKELFSNENFTKNINSEFFKDLFSLAGEMNISEEMNTYIDAIKNNEEAIDKITELFENNNVNKESIIDSFINFANDELQNKDGVDFSNFGNYITNDENIMNLLTDYEDNFKEIKNSEGKKITDNNFDNHENNLTNSEMLQLSSLQYSNDLFRAKNVGKSIKEILLQYDKDGNGTLDSKETKAIEKPGWFKEEQFSEVINDILKDDNVSELTLTDVADIKANYLVAATFENKNKEATVVFEGTDDAQQWSDNFDGLLVNGDDIDNTKVQEAAANYINQVCAERGYKNVSVTGHSKGGNLAQYATVMCPDLVNDCVAFDGQGFTKEWIEANKENIDKTKDKILAINAYFDPVSSLLEPIAGNTKYVDCESTFVTDNDGWPDAGNEIKDFFQDAHCPYGLYKANKDGWYEKDQANIATFISQLSSAIESISPEGKEVIDNIVSDAIDEGYCKDSSIGDKDAIEAKGTEFYVDDFKLVQTNIGYNVYKKDDDDIILAQLNNDFTKRSGSIQQVIGDKNEQTIFNKMKEKLHSLDDKITNMNNYAHGFIDNIKNLDIGKVDKLYKMKDIKKILSYLGVNSSNFDHFCEKVDNNNKKIMYALKNFFEEYKNINISNINKYIDDFFDDHEKIIGTLDEKIMNATDNKNKSLDKDKDEEER